MFKGNRILVTRAKKIVNDLKETEPLVKIERQPFTSVTTYQNKVHVAILNLDLKQDCMDLKFEIKSGKKTKIWITTGLLYKDTHDEELRC